MLSLCVAFALPPLSLVLLLFPQLASAGSQGIRQRNSSLPLRSQVGQTEGLWDLGPIPVFGAQVVGQSTSRQTALILLSANGSAPRQAHIGHVDGSVCPHCDTKVCARPAEGWPGLCAVARDAEGRPVQSSAGCVSSRAELGRRLGAEDPRQQQQPMGCARRPNGGELCWCEGTHSLLEDQRPELKVPKASRRKNLRKKHTASTAGARAGPQLVLLLGTLLPLLHFLSRAY